MTAPREPIERRLDDFLEPLRDFLEPLRDILREPAFLECFFESLTNMFLYYMPEKIKKMKKIA
jgi:hypothetical protein